jgi:hypothetical protein
MGKAFSEGKGQQILPSKKVKDKSYENTDEQAGRQRKIKSKAAPLDVNIARQIAQPWDLASQGEHQSDDNQDDSQEDERFAESIHRFCHSRSGLVMGATHKTKSRGF